MVKRKVLTVRESAITIINQNKTDYISLTDMTVAFREGSALIGKWITNKNTLEYLGVWERINNIDFNYPEFGVIKQEAGTNRFIMSIGQWIGRTNAVGVFVKAGRYGGTYAHKDIAFHFAMWLSPEFQIYLVNEFQRLKEEETRANSIEWDIQRTLSKINYRIHTSAISKNLVPDTLSKYQINSVYASEADLLNVALFGMTAKQWREANPNSKGNIRDYATLEQLVVLSNMESINALLIQQQLSQPERLIQLNATAITQMQALIGDKNIKNLNNY